LIQYRTSRQAATHFICVQKTTDRLQEKTRQFSALFFVI